LCFSHVNRHINDEPLSFFFFKKKELLGKSRGNKVYQNTKRKKKPLQPKMKEAVSGTLGHRLKGGMCVQTEHQCFQRKDSTVGFIEAAIIAKIAIKKVQFSTLIIVFSIISNRFSDQLFIFFKYYFVWKKVL
jgi:hypothetical protein